MLKDVLLKNGKRLWDSDFDVAIIPYWENDSKGNLINIQNQYKISFNKGTYKISPTLKTGLKNVLLMNLM